MKKLLSIILFVFLLSETILSQVNQWTWVGGSNTITQFGIYGTKGVASTSNIPGHRRFSISWKDATGNLWLFGGYGFAASVGGYLNDLWKYNPGTNEWTWVSGSNGSNQVGIYGTKGVPSTSNIPGGRESAISWTDAAGNLWLFGGEGYSSSGFGYLNDLWKFNIATNEWTWVSGSDIPFATGIYGTKGIASVNNIPGNRVNSVSWADGSGNLWLFGGHNSNNVGQGGKLNDLWKFNISSGLWAWMSGSNIAGTIPGVYGTKGIADPLNVPGARSLSIKWIDSYGNFWLFGGSGFDSQNHGGILNDLWKFNPITNQWTWMSGSNLNSEYAVYGSIGIEAIGNIPGARQQSISFADSEGNFWLFGGHGNTATVFATNLNDLWKYNPNNNQWTWMSGSNSGNQYGIYGTKGTANPNNIPGARRYGVSWSDNSGNLWLFGGGGFPASGAAGDLNDLWKFTLSTPVQTVYYFDTDSDGYGHPLLSILAYNPPPGYVNNNSDCNDFNPNAYPGAPEIQNSIDDNCDGQVDEGLITTNQFIYLKGNATEFAIGSYGTQGVAGVGNNPGKRRYQTAWHYNGKIYVFGGEGKASNNGTPPPDGLLSDIWEYDPATNNWRWLKGNSTLGGAAVYGTKGVAAATNTPGARKSAMSWILNNKFYLFGGNNGSRLCDLWEYDPSTNNWTWIAGTNAANSAGDYGTLGLAAATNLPPGREQGVTWIYNNKLYLFSGLRSNGVNDVHMNDLWEYDFGTGWWTWIKGTNLTSQFGIYGSQGVASPSNMPGSRYEAGFASIGSKTYVYGGDGFGAANGGILSDLWEYDNTTGNWTWLKGSTTNDEFKIPGTQGTYGAANTPGARTAGSITVHNNTLYLYGGYAQFFGGSFLSDLWQYDPIINQWRWVKGSSGIGTLGIYGFENVEAAANAPGGRGQGSFISSGTDLYMFGGRGYNSISSSPDESQNDLWKFNTTNNNWTWLKGASGKQYFGEYGTKGFATPPNKPGSKVGASSIGANGKYYLFGGSGNNNYPNGGTSNDLWEYDPVSGNWKWLKGSNTSGAAGNYGTQGVAASTNEPSFRTNAMMWSIGNKIYMYGGTVGANYNDLWEYDITTFNWTWLKGSNTYNQSGVYGTKGVSAASNTPGARWQASAFTYNNKLYLFGGNGLNSGATSGELNDLWEYDPSTNNWTWLSGNDAINSFGIYGTINVAAPANIPGGRETGQMHTIGTKAYLFGGRGYASAGGFQNLNDTWEYDFATNQWTWKKGLSTGGNAGVAGQYGIEDPANYPIARYHATSWALSEKFYVFSGTPFGPEYNDLWEYNPTNNNWRYIKGRGNLGNTPANYGLQGVANHNNLPSIRWQSTSAASGNSAYIFGGLGGFANSLSPNSGTTMNDLWKWVAGPVFTYGTERKLYVNDNSQTGDIYTTSIGNNQNTGTPSAPLATLDFAVSVAQPGDTIFVDAGTYVIPNFTIGKAIAILGPNYTIPVNDVSNMLLYNTGRNPEAIINNSTITIGASNIRIEGLTFDPLSKTQIQQTNTSFDFSNIYILRNRFLISSTFTTINLTGRVISPLLSNTYLIVGNRFEKTGGASGTSVTLNAINVAAVSGNAFVVANSSLASLQTGISIGTSTKVDNLTVAGNVFDRQNAPVSTTRAGTTLIDDNRAYNNRLGLQLNNSVTEPVVISVTRNTFTNTLVNGPIQYNRSGGSDISGSNRLIFTDNSVSVDATGQTFSALIVPVCQSTVANSEVIIKRNIITYTGDFSSFTTSAPLAIRPAGKFNLITIDSNEIYFNGTNLSVNAGGAIPSTGILIFSNPGSATNSIPANAVISINNNKVYGFRQSVAFYNAQLSQYGGLVNGITANASNNSLTGDSLSINNGTTSQTINANCNWYGSAASQSILAKITPSTVNHIPWLTDGTDSDIPMTGFQPLPNICNGTPPVITLDGFTNITCFGANNGTINVTVTGGFAPYNYEWTKYQDPGFASSAEDLSNLAPGTYFLVVRDENDSYSTQLSVTLTEPASALSINLTGINISCFGNNNGSITANVSGGTSPYTYLWNNGATTSSINGLSPGAYTVVVNDAKGCNVSTGYNVTEPSLLTVVMTGTNASCNGSATATPAGGTAPYTYMWNNGATTQTISSIPNGTYTVTVTDANNCTVSGSYTVTGNSTINPTTQLVHVSCFGGSDGSITVTSAGGTAPHTYSINGSIYQNSNVLGGLSAGTYLVAVKDATGCVDFVTRTINQPAVLTVVLDSLRTSCFGTNTGRIYITASGGNAGKAYAWTGPNGYISTAQDPNNIGAGVYNVIVTDSKGCTANLSVTLNQWPMVTVSEIVTNVLCRGDFTGAINVTLTGGTGNGFTCAWTGPNGFTATTEDIAGLKAGNYTITATDNGSTCASQKTIAITQPAANLTISTTKTNATGCNSLGTIAATGAGGTSPYQYSLDGTNYQGSGLFTGLYAATYTVWVKDVNGCNISKVVIITDNGSDEYEGNNNKNQAKQINIGDNIAARIALASDVADWFKFTTPAGAGNYILSLTHPSASFTFNMYPAGNNVPALVPVSTTSTSKEYVLSGNTNYYVNVTGGLSYICYGLVVSPPTSFAATTSDSTIIEKGKPVVFDISKLSVKAYPNPYRESFNLQITSPEEGKAKIEIFTVTGQKLQERTVWVQKSENNIVPFTVAQHGAIFYRVQIGKYIVNGKVIGPN